MTWHSRTKKNPGEFILASDQNESVDNDNHLFDGTQIETDLVTATSIAAGAVGQSEIGSGAVHQDEIDTSPTTVNTPAGGSGHYFPTNNAYLFSPRLYASPATGGGTLTARLMESYAANLLGNSAKAIIYLAATSTESLYASYRHVNSSPPHKVGGCSNWGLFVFQHRKKEDGTVLSGYVSPDPPWDGDDWTPLKKDDPLRMNAIPHPFADLFNKPLPEDEEIVLLDLGCWNKELQLKPKALQLATYRKRKVRSAEEEYELRIEAAIEHAEAEQAKRELADLDAFYHYKAMKAGLKNAHMAVSTNDLDAIRSNRFGVNRYGKLMKKKEAHRALLKRRAKIMPLWLFKKNLLREEGKNFAEELHMHRIPEAVCDKQVKGLHLPPQWEKIVKVVSI
mgnify:CR=1 FL=1